MSAIDMQTIRIEINNRSFDIVCHDQNYVDMLQILSQSLNSKILELKKVNHSASFDKLLVLLLLNLEKELYENNNLNNSSYAHCVNTKKGAKKDLKKEINKDTSADVDNSNIVSHDIGSSIELAKSLSEAASYLAEIAKRMSQK